MEKQAPSTGLVLICCEDGGDQGDGHVRRMLALASALRDREGIAAGFVLQGGDAARIAIQRAGFAVHMICGTAELATLVRAQKSDLLVLDGRAGLSRAEGDALRREVALMAAIEENSDLRLACDFAYYPPSPGARAFGWAGARTVPRIGWEWTLLSLQPHLTPARTMASRPTLLVTMRGGDPEGLTERAARALATLDTSFRMRFVIGAGMKDAEKTASRIVAMKSNYETVEGADDLSTEYASADLALCGFGAAAFELAAFGVPALYLALTGDDARAAGAFGAAGMGDVLGVADGMTDADIAGPVRALMNNPLRRRQMRVAGIAALDGQGAARIAADLAQALREEKFPVRAAR